LISNFLIQQFNFHEKFFIRRWKNASIGSFQFHGCCGLYKSTFSLSSQSWEHEKLFIWSFHIFSNFHHRVFCSIFSFSMPAFDLIFFKDYNLNFIIIWSFYEFVRICVGAGLFPPIIHQVKTREWKWIKIHQREKLIKKNLKFVFFCWNFHLIFFNCNFIKQYCIHSHV